MDSATEDTEMELGGSCCTQRVTNLGFQNYFLEGCELAEGDGDNGHCATFATVSAQMGEMGGLCMETQRNTCRGKMDSRCT